MQEEIIKIPDGKMKKKLLFLLLGIIIIILIVVGIYYSDLFKKNNIDSSQTSDSFKNLKPGIIKISEGQGDEVYDDRSPIEVCDSILKQIQDLNSNLECQIINSTRIDARTNFEKECPTEYSIAGCFSCTFDCK